MTEYKVGNSIDGFIITQAKEISEIHCTLIELEHKQSGAQVLHLANDDVENVFSLNFRTLPTSSNGVAHILEHTVLCGSKKYPVRDPFFLMNRRSLNTFMNAFTGSDFTCYPAASQVEKDFYNLLDVYLDAVFSPLLKKESFLQEGHRLEFAQMNDPASRLLYKGVVYNEMKGALASPHTRLMEAVGTALFPHSAYGFNSGGDPKEIPQLSYDELIHFHEQYYHPSRCLFCFYGNIPLEKHLEFLSEKVLKGTKRLEPLAPVPLQKRYTSPVHKETFYPPSGIEDNDKSYVALAWLTCSVLDNLTVLGLSILDSVLMNTDVSYLKKELLKSGLTTQVSSFMDADIREVPYVLVLKGCKRDDIDAIQSLVRNTLIRLSQEGIPERLVQHAIHQLELSRLEITGDGIPFGLSLIMRSALLKQHGGNAEDSLRIYSLFEELEERLQQNPRFLEELLVSQFINNPHFVSIVMSPKQGIIEEETQEEQERLLQIRNTLTENDISKIIKQSEELVGLQEKEEENKNIDVLPKILLKDVPIKARDFFLKRTSLGNVELFSHPTFTNYITYADMVFPVAHIEPDELWLLRLFASCLTQIGNNSRSYDEVLEYMQENTGGVSAYASFNFQVDSCTRFLPSFHLRGKSLFQKAPKLFSLMYDMIMSPNFTNKDRLYELIRKYFTGITSSLNQNALKYAITLALSSFGSAHAVENELYGLPYFYKMRELAHNFDTNATTLVEQFQEMQSKVLATAGAHIVIACDKTELSKYIESGLEGLQDIPKDPFSPWDVQCPQMPFAPIAKIIPAQVSFTAKAYQTVPYAHQDSALLTVAGRLFDNVVLHKRIREQGGAYGSGATHHTMAGVFYFYSFRDPNVATTLTAFDEAVDTIANGDFTQNDIEDAQLEVVQNLDSPVSPGSRAELAYAWWKEGKTYEHRQAFRDRLLGTQKKAIMDVVQRHFVPHLKNAPTVSFGGKELLEQENRKIEAAGLQPFTIEQI